MNREQRRRAARLTPAKQGNPASRQFQMRYGHDGQRLHLVMPFAVADLVFTEEQAADHIKMMQGLLDDLRAHKAKATPPPPAPPGVAAGVPG